MTNTILIPLDGSPLAERAIPPAAVIAQRGGGRLVLVRAVPYLSRPDDDRSFSTLAAAREAATIEARAYLDGWVTRLAQDGLVVTAELTEKHEAEGIAKVAHQVGATLITMTTHGRSGLGRWVFGSVVENLLTNTPAPILLVRGWRGALPDIALENRAPIVVPLDGSPLAEAALPVAKALATDLQAPLHLLRTVPRPAVGWLPDVLAGSRDDEEGEEQQQAASGYLETIATRLRASGFSVTTETAIGAPVTIIEEASQRCGASLVVMSTQGRTGLRRIALGSVADAVVRQGTVPVVLIRPRNSDPAAD